MHIKSLLSTILLVVFVSIEYVEANDNSKRLQSLIDDHSGTSATQVVIDLNEKNISGEIDETVYVRNKSNVKFVNGSLTSACNPMIEIDDESTLEVGSGITITGNGFGDAFHIMGGTLVASLGSTMQSRNYTVSQQDSNNKSKRMPQEPYLMWQLITLLKDGSNFTLNGGVIYGSIKVRDKKVNVTIQSGIINAIQEEVSNDDETKGKPSIWINGGEVGLIGNRYYGNFNANLYVYGGKVDYIGTYGSVRVSESAEVEKLIQMSSDTEDTPMCQFFGGRVHQAQTSYNAWIRGNACVDSLSLPERNTYLMCWGTLNHDICLGVMGRVEGDVIAKGVSTLTAFREDFDSTGAPDAFFKHQITESDKEHIKAFTNEEVIDGTNIHSINMSNWQLCHEYPQSTTLMDNTIILKSATQAIEAYAVYSDDGTLTFYYDKKRNSRTGTTFSLNSGTDYPRWKNYGAPGFFRG